MKKYVITCETEAQIDKLIEQLITPGVSPSITTPGCDCLKQSIRITNYYPSSQVDVEVELTQEQFDCLKYYSDILAISEVNDDVFCEPSFKGKKRKLTQSYTSSNDSIPESWAMSRCSSISALAPWNQDFTYYLTGSSVDLVVIDGGINPNHPEWNSPTNISRLQFVNWSNYAPVTANRTINVSVGPGTGGGNHVYYINSIEKGTVYVVKDREAAFGKGYPVTSRTGVYDFVLDGTTTNGHPFFIGEAINSPFDTTYVSNNGATTGTVSLTVWPFNDQRSINAGNQSVMYYWCGNHSGMGGIISRTDFNTQSTDNFFYSDNGGHGTHCTGTAAGSACGWAIESAIYSIKTNFYDSYGYANIQSGVKQMYDHLIGWHRQKMLNPSLSSRPTVTSNSYGWPTGFNYIDVDLKVKELTDNGIHYVHAAGNDNNIVVEPGDTALWNSGERIPSPTYPEGYWSTQADNPVIDVGALGAYTVPFTQYRADYSNYGSGVSLYAPGTYIQSAWHNTSYATYPAPFSSFGLRKISGTSMATPNVAGVLATMLDENPGLTPLQAKQKLLTYAIVNAVSSNSFYNIYGFGQKAGGNPLTLSQYPATFVATTSSSEPILKYTGRCYNKITNINPSGSFYFLSGYNNDSVFFMNSATEMVFTNAC